ncbi:MAG: YdcF family protein [Clostridiales bacterium]|nr:YdcF family protein [Clostridiales bacterium]
MKEGFNIIPRLIQDITDFIFVNDGPGEADIIFIPGGGHQALPDKAAELYNAGYAPYVLPSGKYAVSRGAFGGVRGDTSLYPGPYGTECEFFFHVLVTNGVPADSIITECDSTFTRENGFFSRRMCDSMKLEIKKAILCCKSFHAKRALTYYQCAFPEAEIRVVAVDVNGISPDNWYKTRKGFDRVMSELTKCGSQAAESLGDYMRRMNG